ncbi:MAG TPA: DUF3050 domain-containing protein [Gemmataceae bacterium]|nr:DUF3050 domain-containing protein [Gemmataceae bacterium]
MTRLQRLRERLVPFKAALLDHRVYREIDDLQALHVFMEQHVFAVWDFMSLLKALQRRLCCVEVPWLPTSSPLGSRLVNEIVLGEESDEDGQDGFISHFDLYHRAMIQAGASTTAIDSFLSHLRRGKPISAALEAAAAANCVRSFVEQTFRFIEEGDLCAIASAFTFGREDLLPAVFQRIVDELNMQSGGGLEDFKYYLHRHIGLDEEQHGPMANRLLLDLCGSDEARWRVAEQAAVESLKARQELWDGISTLIGQAKESCTS